MMPKDIGDASDDRYPGTVAIINAALVAVAVTSTAAWLVLGLSHLGDRYKVGHVQGIWMALAQVRARRDALSAPFRWSAVRRHALYAAADRPECRREPRDR